MISFPVLDASNSLRVPIALISLDDQAQRREELRKRGIPDDWLENYFSATDMRLTKENVVARFGDVKALSRRYRAGMRPTELGCSYSHREAVTSLLKNTDDDLFLILEDDFIPRNRDFIKDTLEVARFLQPLAKKNEAFLCLLGTRNANYHGIYKRHVISNYKLPNDIRVFLSTSTNQYLAGSHAYLISRSAAQRTRDLEKGIASIADDWGYRQKMGLIKHLFFCDPDIIEQDLEIESTLDGPKAVRFEKQPENLSQIVSRLAIKAPLNRLLWLKDIMVARLSSPFQFRVPD